MPLSPPPPPVKSRRILVIDDEPMVRSVIARLLEEWEFKVVEADNGRTGLALARKLQGDLSMVVTDLVMPYMDGYEFASAFHRLYPDVPILFITGECPTALVGKLSTHREQLLFKPFDPDTFLDAVARLMESRINGTQVTTR
jgi:CheY-like chemotaxis protein